MIQEGLILDRYEPLGTAGEGGFGTVQIAWDPRIQRRVAIKTIRLTALDAARAALPGAQAVAADGVNEPDFEQDEQRNDQVTALSHMPGLDEARTAAMIVDPRIVAVYDFEVRDRTAYLIMEYVEGITLTDLLVDYDNYLTLDMVTAVFDSVADALMVAHDAGVLHLDIKPDNILINKQGQVKVTDFGLATLADASGAGRTGGGTIGYMPPEQIKRETLDARADEWALASVAYEMLTGSNPFRVETLAEAEAAIRNAELVLPSLCWKDLDSQIDDVLFYALDPEREERYATVADFVEEMDKFLGSPDRGAAQLELVVADALSSDADAEDFDGSDGQGPGTDLAAPRKTFTERLLGLLPGAEDAESDGGDAEDGSADGAEFAGDRRPHEPLATKMSPFALTVLSHCFGASGSGFIAALSFANMDPLVTALGSGSDIGIGMLVLIVGALGALRSHIGAIVSYCLLGVALVMCGHPVAGAVLLVATVVWWYVIGHEGSAAANSALLLPMAGAIGGASMVPFFTGASERPLRALGTTAFVVVVAVILAGFGSGSLLDWNVFANGDFGRNDVSGLVWRLLRQPATWAVIASWFAAAFSLSLLRLRESKLLTILGLAVAMAAVLVGSLAFSSPTPQLIVPSIFAVVAIGGVLL